MEHPGGLFAYIHSQAAWKTPLGDIQQDTPHNLLEEIENQTFGQAAVLVCTHPLDPLLGTSQERTIRYANLLELFLFVEGRPPSFPSIVAIAQDLECAIPEDNTPQTLISLMEQIQENLFHRLKKQPIALQQDKKAWALFLQKHQWPFTPLILEQLSEIDSLPTLGLSWKGTFERLPIWENTFPPPPPQNTSFTEEEAIAHLRELVAQNGEQRETQENFTRLISHIFQSPPEAQSLQESSQSPTGPTFVLAEAGTGVGKTLGYLAAADAWSRKSRSQIWISTYTHTLQEQLLQEIKRLYPDPKERKENVCLRKGQNNYVCLLNVESILQQSAHFSPWETFMGVALLAWINHTQDGDMKGADFPHWLDSMENIWKKQKKLSVSLLYQSINDHEECLHNRCPHYQKCFAKRIQVQSRSARFVIANHAMTLHMRGPLSQNESFPVPRYIIFDEAHHLFSSADSFFTQTLSAKVFEKYALYFIGEGQQRRRSYRGFSFFIETFDHPKLSFLQDNLKNLKKAAAALFIRPGFFGRLSSNLTDFSWITPSEKFFANLRTLILEKTPEKEKQEGYPLEVSAGTHMASLTDEATELHILITHYLNAIKTIRTQLKEALEKSFFAENDLVALQEHVASLFVKLETWQEEATQWIQMLDDLLSPPSIPDDSTEECAPPIFSHIFFLERNLNTEFDVGLNRHPIDPTRPLYDTFLNRTHGLAMVSATLSEQVQKDSMQELSELTAEEQKQNAFKGAFCATGAQHHPLDVHYDYFPSPFDYENQTRAWLVTDVGNTFPSSRQEIKTPLGEAFFQLFTSAGGGGLGLFTSIRRLQQIARVLKKQLMGKNITLWTQHLDSPKTKVLIDLFKAEPTACILGADSLRDGIDIPGNSLKLVIFEKIPWSRRSILHGIRQAYWKTFYGLSYEDRLVRARIKQGFGRLIRHPDDRGIFIIFAPHCPSRLLATLPEGTTIKKKTLSQAKKELEDFF